MRCHFLPTVFLAAFSLCFASVGAVNVTQLIEAAGYPQEQHYVFTTGGFVLSVQRIPHGRSGPGNTRRPVVLLQHGLEDCSATWVANSPSESLGFILADAGFDVWMGNSRGNTYSRTNTQYSPDSEDFWAFSFDQMASPGDLKSVIPYIIGQTGAPSIGYVGHSQGTLEAFVAFSRDPELASMVNAYAALAPVAYVGHVSNLAIRALSEIDFAEWLTLFGAKDFLPHNDVIIRAFPVLCKIAPHVCEDFLLYIMGYDRADVNATRLPEYVSFDPAGTSVLNMHHWSQAVHSNTFRMFDYGSAEANARHYNGSTSPPAYHLSDYPSEKVPLALFAGGKDNLADPRDVARMREELPQPFAYHEYPEYSHISFVWGTDAAEKVYPDVQAHLMKHAPTA